MTEETTTTKSLLERRAREMYEATWNDVREPTEWEKLSADTRELWRKKVMETPPLKVARGLKLELLPPYALEAVEASKVDPRTHDKKVHAEFETEWVRLVTELRSLCKPAPEDLEIRRQLQELGFPVFNTSEGAPQVTVGS